ncbi:MAG: MBL fold metallo-hydrolase, partial [Pseudomonadota bacterium]
SIYDGIFTPPVSDGFVQGATVEEVKKALKAGGHVGDVVPLEFAFTVIKTGGQTILIDAGTGGQLVPTAGLASTGMKNAGIALGDISKVLVSHMHGDHTYGLVDKETKNQIFPEAEILINETEYKFWTDEGNNSKLNDRFRKQAERHQATFPKFKNVTLFKDDAKELAPGINAVAAKGHTVGHTAFHISSGNDQLILIGDAVLTPALFVTHPEWQVAVDADKEAAKKTRYNLMQRAVDDKMMIAGYHFGFPNSGKLEKDGIGFAFVPVS